MIGFESDEAVLQKLRERLRNMTDAELIHFGKTVSQLSGSVQEFVNRCVFAGVSSRRQMGQDRRRMLCCCVIGNVFKPL
jgi:hypothetical protein